MRRVVIKKSVRRLTLYDGEALVLQCKIALGKEPIGHKQREGDGRTPEGAYFICLKRETGKFGCALGISYPSLRDALQAGIQDEHLLSLLAEAEQQQKRPPWGTALGGEIYIHGGGTASDWTAGCIALEQADMDRLFSFCQVGDRVIIVP